jgi:ribosome-binding factor A
MSKRNFRSPSQRQLRVGEEIRHALAHILERREVRDPDIAGKAITVTEVRISPDLKNATAYVVPLGGIGDVVEITAALNRIKSFFRHRVAQSVHLRSAPNLLFLADTTFDEASHINDLLHLTEVARDLKGSDNNGT